MGDHHLGSDASEPRHHGEEGIRPPDIRQQAAVERADNPVLNTEGQGDMFKNFRETEERVVTELHQSIAAHMQVLEDRNRGKEGTSEKDFIERMDNFRFGNSSDGVRFMIWDDRSTGEKQGAAVWWEQNSDTGKADLRGRMLTPDEISEIVQE